jgi:hypothetical protein
MILSGEVWPGEGAFVRGFAAAAWGFNGKKLRAGSECVLRDGLFKVLGGLLYLDGRNANCARWIEKHGLRFSF